MGVALEMYASSSGRFFRAEHAIPNLRLPTPWTSSRSRSQIQELRPRLPASPPSPIDATCSWVVMLQLRGQPSFEVAEVAAETTASFRSQLYASPLLFADVNAYLASGRCASPRVKYVLQSEGVRDENTGTKKADRIIYTTRS